MTFVTRAGVAAAGLAATAALAGCGSTGGTLLSADAADQLKSELNQASTALTDDNCVSAQNALAGFSSDVSQLPNVNATLVRILRQSADTITALAEKRCPTGDATTTTATATTTTQSTTTTTESVTTATVATTTTAPITTETIPPDGGTGFGTTTSQAVTTTPPVTPTTTSTPDSGGAGLGGTGNTGAGGGGGL